MTPHRVRITRGEAWAEASGESYAEALARAIRRFRRFWDSWPTYEEIVAARRFEGDIEVTK